MTEVEEALLLFPLQFLICLLTVKTQLWTHSFYESDKVNKSQNNNPKSFFLSIRYVLMVLQITSTNRTAIVFSSLSLRMCRRVCRGNPKGLSQRSHLFRRQGQQCSPLKGNMERSTGISFGSHWAILCCSQHGQTALGPVVCCCWVSLLCLLWEDFTPCAAIKISVFIYRFSPLSSYGAS